MRDRGRGAPLDHECANPAVGEDLQGMAVVMRQRLTPQSLAYSIDYRADIGYRADRRHSTVPNNSLALRLSPSQRSVCRRSAFNCSGLSRYPFSASRLSRNGLFPISVLKAVRVRLPRAPSPVAQEALQLLD